ncbi:hypothetical protein [Fibrella aquatilis]|uniref:Uncharacterized protein n=1 Tax=Fibrella aquatilis TaxID=2817059 RepID=A0A939G5P0_9BACT|nr:hypothetical protein [Fibrella aquatilis]MBO0932847.1 hypothetical protein [Fibrella aquatilis]
MTIQIDVNDDVLRQLGEERLRQMIQDKVHAEEFRLAADSIKQDMDIAANQGVDWNNEFDRARQDAWEEYKQKRNWQ